MEASLDLAGIKLVCYYILWFLLCYLVWQDRKALVVSPSDPIHCHHVTLTLKSGWSWFQRFVLQVLWGALCLTLFIASISIEGQTVPSRPSGE